MKKFFPVLLAAAAIASPAFGGPAGGTPATSSPIRTMSPPQIMRQPSNAELLQAINNLGDQVTQLRAELGEARGRIDNLQNKLDNFQNKETDDYQKTNWRIVQTCKLIYLRSFKAGDNPSSGQGGNPYLPMDWCEIGSYPYWKSVQ